MNRKILLIVGLALIAAICFIPSAMDPRFVAKNPFETELQLSYYNFAVRDRDNSLIIIDNGLSANSEIHLQPGKFFFYLLNKQLILYDLAAIIPKIQQRPCWPELAIK